MKHLTCALCLLAGSAFGAPLVPALPAGSIENGRNDSPAATFRMPTGAWTPTTFPIRALEGTLSEQAWRVPGSQLTTLQLVEPLRAQIRQAGWTILFECETDACGGFDFRYGMSTLPEPEMHVDLTDFRYLAATGPVPGEAATVLVSRSTESGFVQITQVSPAQNAPALSGPPSVADQILPPVTDAAAANLVAALEGEGHATLDDLAFASGSSDLAAGQFASLKALAGYLADHPAARVTLVGHTDAVGGLDANIAISRQRAEAARKRLISDYGVKASQVDAAGAGWLAPRASNLTEAGREKNRRVEVVLTSTRN